MNKGREYLRKLKQVQKYKGDEPLNQEEIDILYESLKRKDELNQQRKPWIGCLISIIGTLIFWGSIWWFVLYLQSVHSSSLTGIPIT